ncbi:family 16 glycosylhydrolase [Haloferula sp.]|uniref:family 16 glycosylhydrolase n=1 Tax=Haloferula sp. TaxID=2497595 RepID=UPI00329E3645
MTSRFLIPLAATVVIHPLAADERPLPLSDPENQGDWVFNEKVSDEFNDGRLDRNKWFVQGENGGDYYIWKGRPPSQFAEHNVLEKDGKLKIRTQWEPDFKFAQERYADGKYNDAYGMLEGKPLPVTTGAVISRERFLYGYMEVRTKAGDASITSSFWAIGYESELDIYEQMGKPKIGKTIGEKTWKASVHDWSPPAKRPTRRFGLEKEMNFRVAEEFHVYAAEWGEDDLKLYLDGKKVWETTREKEGRNWVLNNPLEIWFDSEIFKWNGLPNEEELPVDYEIDYIRIWQKPDSNLLARQLFGFEGPILFEETGIPLDLVPESAEVNEYQKFWEIGEHSWSHFEIVKDKAVGGIKSLKFMPQGMLSNLSIVSPARSVELPAGKFELSFQVFVTKNCGVEALDLSLADPEVKIDPFDLSELERGKWATVKAAFERDVASGEHDRFRIRVRKDAVDAEAGGALYLDDITIVRCE